MSEPGVTVTIKGGAAYDAPWIVVQGATVGELVTHLRQLEENAILPKVKKLGRIFSDMPANTAEAVGNVKAAMPGSEVTSSQELPESMTAHKCGTCGEPATLRSGTYQKGPKTGQPYKGYFCTAAKNHKPELI